MTLLRQGPIHPPYQTEEKQVTKPNTEDKATRKRNAIKGTIKEKVGQNDPESEADDKAKKMPGKLKTG